MYSVEILEESISKECYKDIMDMVLKNIDEAQADNALDNILGGAGATKDILVSGASKIADGVKGIFRSASDRINKAENIKKLRSNAAQAASNYRKSVQQYSQHMKNAPGKDAPAGVQLHHKIRANDYKKQASTNYTNYQNAKKAIPNP